MPRTVLDVTTKTISLFKMGYSATGIPENAAFYLTCGAAQYGAGQISFTDQ